MKHSFVILSLVTVSLAIGIVACSSNGPVTIRGNDSPVASRDIGGPQVAKLQPVAPGKKRSDSIPLVEKLIAQANQALGYQQADRAIEMAERALRFDRKEPRLFLILAEAYGQKANIKQARFFAKQGLRYARQSEWVYRQLKTLAE